MLIGIKIFNALDAEKDCTDFIEPLALMSRLAQLDVTSTIPDPFTVGHHVSLEGHAYLKRLERQSSKLFDIFRRTYPGRKLFLLDNGELGLGTGAVQPGDSLCIVADGGRTPVLLRKQADRSPCHWRWIGEAYVDGIMYGEAVDMMDERGQFWQEAFIV